MYLLVRKEPIVFKNCFRFGLKEIAKCMFDHGLIETRLESQCESGLDAGLRAYQELCKTSDRNDQVISDIAKYNRFDVKVLAEIMEVLRVRC